MVHRTPLIASAVLLGLACGKPKGTEPHEMGVAQHEASAGQEETAAAEHARQFDPNAGEVQLRCAASEGLPCWTSIVNPTQDHREDAERHRDLARQHRAAAQALRDTEVQACAGLSEADRDMSPFNHREDIVSVTRLEHEVGRGSSRAGQLAGGRALFRAVPGMTAEWLQRHVDCHVARASAVGHEVPEMPYCPLMLGGITAKVTSTGSGFAIDVTAEGAGTSEEIWRRMQGLAPQVP